MENHQEQPLLDAVAHTEESELKRAIAFSLELGKTNSAWGMTFLQAFTDSNQLLLDHFKFKRHSIVPALPPVVVVQIGQGLVRSVNSDQQARVIVLDQDIDGVDENDLDVINGVKVNAWDFELLEEAQPEHDGVDHALVSNVVQQLNEIYRPEMTATSAAKRKM